MLNTSVSSAPICENFPLFCPREVSGSDLALAFRLRDADVNLCEVRRPLEQALAEELQCWTGTAAFTAHGRVSVLPDSIEAFLKPFAEGQSKIFFRQELARLLPIFTALTEVAEPTLTLGIVDHDACRKFHTDEVGIRMLCTYTGPGTEWVPNAGVRREHLGRGDIAWQEANALVLGKDTVTQRSGEGDLLWLKGEAWPGNRGWGAVHRSPSVQGSGVRRLLLKIDMHPCAC